MSKQNAGEEMQINFAFQPQVVQHPEEKMHIILFYYYSNSKPTKKT